MSEDQIRLLMGDVINIVKSELKKLGLTPFSGPILSNIENKFNQFLQRGLSTSPMSQAAATTPSVDVEKISRYEAIISAKNAELNELNKEIDELKKKLVTYQKEIENITKYKMLLAKKDEEINTLKNKLEMIERYSGDTSRLVTQIASLKKELSDCNEKLKAYMEKVRSQEEEINRLYNLTEDDPRYQPYYVLRDEAPSWVSFSYISNLTGIPTSKVKKILKEFELRGLVEIKGEQARCLQLIRDTKTKSNV